MSATPRIRALARAVLGLSLPTERGEMGVEILQSEAQSQLAAAVAAWLDALLAAPAYEVAFLEGALGRYVARDARRGRTALVPEASRIAQFLLGEDGQTGRHMQLGCLHAPLVVPRAREMREILNGQGARLVPLVIRRQRTLAEAREIQEAVARWTARAATLRRRVRTEAPRGAPGQPVACVSLKRGTVEIGGRKIPLSGESRDFLLALHVWSAKGDGNVMPRDQLLRNVTAAEARKKLTQDFEDFGAPRAWAGRIVRTRKRPRGYMLRPFIPTRPGRTDSALAFYASARKVAAIEAGRARRGAGPAPGTVAHR